MTGFEPRTSGFGSNCFANCATTTALILDLSRSDGIPQYFCGIHYQSFPTMFDLIGVSMEDSSREHDT